MEGTQAKSRSDMPLKATDCPEELTWDTASPSLASTPCWQLNLWAFHLKAVGGGKEPGGVVGTAPQTCKPWDRRLACRGHWPPCPSHRRASHHLGFPTHCGDSPATYSRDPKCRNHEGHILHRGQAKARRPVASQNDRATWTLPSLIFNEVLSNYFV